MVLGFWGKFRLKISTVDDGHRPQPAPIPVSQPKDLTSSMNQFYEMVIGPESERAVGGSQLAAEGYGGVDIKDVSEAMAKVLTVPEAGGQRLIVCAGE